MTHEEPSPVPPELVELFAAERIAPIVVAAYTRDRLFAAIALVPAPATRLARLARAMRRRLDGPTLPVVAACTVIVVMFATNDDMGGDARAPRGDGHYRPVLARGDGHMLYLMARSTALDGDWNFDNDLKRFGDPWNEPRTKTGRKSIVHPIGPALVWTPLIWIAEGAAAIANAAGADIPLHGYTLWHQRFVFLSSALFGCGAVLLGRKLARQALGGRWAASYAAVAVLLGTSLTYYATYMPSYGHAMDAIACAAFLAYWAATLGRCDLRRWIALGVWLGIAMLIRVQEVAMGVAIAIEIAVRVWQAPRGAPRWMLGGALALAIALVVFVPQLIEWHVVFGSITELPQGARFTRPAAPMVMELLYSARNGWFSTTPIAYAGVIGLGLMPRRSRLLAAGLLAVVATQVYLDSTILDWWGMASFGQRRLCNVTLPIVVGLATLIARVGARIRVPRPIAHAVLVAVLGVFVAWNLCSVRKLAGGKPAPSDLAPSCCSELPAALGGVAQWLYDRIGNPFELPASAVFAVRHHVPLSRWDVAVGSYELSPSFRDLQDRRRVRGAWRVGSPNMTPYLVGGWSGPQQWERLCRFTTTTPATLLVPNLLPYDQRLTLWIAPADAHHVTLRWNGEVVADRELGEGWTAIAIDLPEMALHTNELAVEAAIGATGRGVAVGDLELALQ